MKKALLSFIILFISFNCFGTEKEIADAVRSTRFLPHPELENIVAGYAETFSDEWLDILNKLNELAPRTSNLRNKAIQALVDILTGYIGARDRFIRGIFFSQRAAAGLPFLIGAYSAESIERYARELLAKPATSEMGMKLMSMTNDFESIKFYFEFEAHQNKSAAEVYNNAIDKLETMRKLASTKDGFKSLLRLYDLTHEIFGGNNWNEAWTLNPEKLRNKIQEQAISQSNAESAACQNQDIAARTSKKRKEPDERADDSTESKKRKIDDEQSQEL